MSKDTIYREDAIEQLNEAISICPPCMKGTGIYRTSALEEAIDIIDQIPAADRPQGWIPVSERLPKTGVANQCLVTVEFPRAHSCGVYCGSRVADNDWESLDIEGTWQTLSGISKVLAWMPLPEPWKGEDDE